MSGHGHVVPNVDGLKARCGGPAICSVCARELHAFNDSEIERLRARVAELEAELAAAKSDLEWARNPGQNGF